MMRRVSGVVTSKKKYLEQKAKEMDLGKLLKLHDQEHHSVALLKNKDALLTIRSIFSDNAKTRKLKNRIDCYC